MATNYYSLLLLLLALVSWSCLTIEKSDAAAKHHHFHTLQITSLLPASICTTTPSTGSSKRQSTLEVFHRHGPCSKLNQDKAAGAAAAPPLSEVLSHDQSRVESIQARLNPDSTTNKINDKKANLPAQSGQSLGSGNYVVTIGLGTPNKSLTLIFDTGSDLTWTQCQPCVRVCYPQQDPIFDPSSSSSYSKISCDSSECSELTSATGNTPGCASGTCVYVIQYGDQSFSSGFFSKDKLTLTPTDVFPSFLFGCGQINQGLFGKTAGLIGFGRDPLSIISQTATKYGKYFSYCLPSVPSQTGHLTLGKSGTSSKVKFTPFATSRGTSFYFIDIISISVGGRQLSINQTVFQKPGTIIDSGTVITRLPPSAYSALSSTFQQQMKQYPRAPPYSILDTCYDFGNATSIEIPTISFTFSGDVNVDLDPSGILVVVNTTQACLAFAGNSDSSDVGIFGNTQQMTLEVVYDVAGGKLGFGAGGCN